MISGHQEFFFLAIWWAGYFFSLKLFITFVLHAIFFLRQALAGNFFSKSPPPPPPQELNGRPLTNLIGTRLYNIICMVQSVTKITLTLVNIVD